MYIVAIKGLISKAPSIHRFFIQAKLLVDQNAHRKNAPVTLVEQEFFGEVQYFFSHQYNDYWSMLAYVQWAQNPPQSGHGPLKF